MAFPEGQEPMKSMVPEGAIIPVDTIPPETHVDQPDLDKAAEAKGKLIEMFGQIIIVHGLEERVFG